MRKNYWLISLLVSLVVGMASFFAPAGTAHALMLKMGLEELSTGAQSIVAGNVIEKNSSWNEDKTRIYTSVVVSVDETIKGTVEKGTITVTVPGGEVDGLTEWVSDTPEFAVGEKVVLFLTESIEGKTEIYGSMQGKFDIAGGKVGILPLDELKSRINKALNGEKLPRETDREINAAYGPTITGISPGTASAGTGSQVTISGSGFGNTQGYAAFFYQQSKPYIAAKIISWSDSSVVAEVPIATVDNYPASASSGPVFIRTAGNTDSNKYPFEVTFSYGGRKQSGDLSYKVNPNTYDCVGEETAIQNAGNSWNAVPNKNFSFNYAGSTNATSYSRNYTNEIMWKNLGNVGTIARAVSWYQSDSPYYTENDIEFNDYYSWSTSGYSSYSSMDVESIAVHELGHWLGLRDLYGNQSGYPQDSDKIMYGFGSEGSIKRTLHSGDMAGIQWIYPSGSGDSGFSVSGQVYSSNSGGSFTIPRDSAGGGNDYAAAEQSKSSIARDSFEESNAQANPISIGQTVNGTLSSSDSRFTDGSYYDLYSFSATAGQKLAISMSSQDFDTWLYLYNSGLTRIAYDNNGGGGTNSRIPAGTSYWTVPADGTYYIAANSLLSGKTGNYTLSLTSENSGGGGGGGSTGISGVTMTFSSVNGAGTVPAPVQTDTSGNWSQSGFTSGTTYRVTPSKAGYTFTPAYIDFSSSSTTLNFTGVQGGGGGGQVTAVTLAADRTSPQPAGTTVTFTATATGSSNAVYQFWYQNPSGAWANAGAYSSNNTFQLTNTVAGSYTVVAYARDAVSSQQPVASNAVSFSFTSGGGGGGRVNSVTLTASPGGPQGAGTNVTFTAAAVGSSSPVYQFWVMSPSGSWSSSGAYSANNTYQLTNTVAGTYNVVVYAMDAGSSQWEATTNLAYTFTSGSSGHVTSVNISASASEPVSAGTSVTFTAIATGSNSPMYQFWVMNPAGYWTSSGQFAPINTYSLNNTIPGNYTVLVFARDVNAQRWEAHDITAFRFN